MVLKYQTLGPRFVGLLPLKQKQKTTTMFSTAPPATTTPYNKTTTLKPNNNNPLLSSITTTQFRSGNRCRRVSPVMVVKTDELTVVGLEKEKENKKSLADELRLGSLTEDGLSYKEKFIVRCYEVGIGGLHK